MAVVMAINRVSGGISCPEVDSNFPDWAHLSRSKLFFMLRMGLIMFPKQSISYFFKVLFDMKQ